MVVRRESVKLELIDGFSTEMARAAAATALLNRELGSLSGSAVQTSRATRTTSSDVDTMARSADKADNSINKLTGRLRLFADLTAMLGPSLVPLGAGAIPMLTGLASQLGFTALAAGGLVTAFQGVGEALKATSEARLDPTEANLAKAQDAMAALSPAAQDLVTKLDGLTGEWKNLQAASATALFPGASAALDDLMTRLPEVRDILVSVNSTLGDIMADGAESLASERWDDFFSFLATDAPSALTEMAESAGNLAHAASELWMAFDPVNDFFSRGLVDATERIDEWATGLSETAGFQEFLDYVETNGPRAAEALGALGEAFLQIVEAAAPVGEVTLPILTKILDLVGAIADSDLGTPILAGAAAWAAYSRSAALAGRVGLGNLGALKADFKTMGDVGVVAWGRTTTEAERFNAAASRTRGTLSALGKGAGIVGALALASSGAADSIGLTNTASLALMGTMAGPWGAALGAAAGFTLDLAHANDGVEEAIKRANAAASSGTSTIPQLQAAQAALADQMKSTREEVDKVSLGLRNMPVVGALADKLWQNRAAGDEDAALRAQEAAIKRITELRQQSAYSPDRSYYYQLEDENDALAQNIAAMRAKREEALRGFSATTNYAAALMDSKKAIEDNGKAWNLSTEAGLNNRRAIEQQASAWNQLNENAKQSPAAFAKAKDELVETATQMGATKEQAQRLANQLLDIPDKIVPHVSLLGVETAITNIDRVRNALAQVRDKTVTIRVTQSGTAAASPGFGPVSKSAAGGILTVAGGPPLRLDPHQEACA